MKKILIVLLVLNALLYSVKLYKDYEFTQRIDKMNAHIKQLHDDGYSWEASRKIGATEAGFIPIDAEYNALIED
jgi:hypothetical protein